MGKTIEYSLTAVLALAAASCGEGSKAYDASGVFESTEVTVSTEGNGRIMSLALQEGDRLEAGSVVGCIDTVQLYLGKVQLEATMKAVGSGRLDISRQIAALESQIEKQRQELERFTNLERRSFEPQAGRGHPGTAGGSPKAARRTKGKPQERQQRGFRTVGGP